MYVLFSVSALIAICMGVAYFVKNRQIKQKIERLKGRLNDARAQARASLREEAHGLAPQLIEAVEWLNQRAERMRRVCGNKVSILVYVRGGALFSVPVFRNF